MRLNKFGSIYPLNCSCCCNLPSSTTGFGDDFNKKNQKIPIYPNINYSITMRWVGGRREVKIQPKIKKIDLVNIDEILFGIKNGVDISVVQSSNIYQWRKLPQKFYNFEKKAKNNSEINLLINLPTDFNALVALNSYLFIFKYGR